jgi:hypothetical protein
VGRTVEAFHPFGEGLAHVGRRPLLAIGPDLGGLPDTLPLLPDLGRGGSERAIEEAQTSVQLGKELVPRLEGARDRVAKALEFVKQSQPRPMVGEAVMPGQRDPDSIEVAQGVANILRRPARVER